MITNVGMFRKGWAEDAVLSEAEIPVDPALPHLSTMLNGTVMGGILREALPEEFNGADFGTMHCRVASVSYRPGRRCRVSYVLNTGKTGSELDSPRVVTAKAKIRKSGERQSSKQIADAGAEGIRSTYLSDYAMAITAFPNDLRLFGVRRIFDSDYLDAVIRRALCEPAAKVVRSEDGSPLVSIASYRPELSCLFRCLIQRPGKANRNPEVAYARMYRDNVGEEIFHAMAALWNGSARRTGLLSVAEPLGYDPVERVLFQGGLSGGCLTDMSRGEGFLDYVGMAARSLAAIHECPIRLKRSRSVDYELNRLEIWVRSLVGVLPEARERLDGILCALRHAMPTAQGRARTLVHGDFSLNQVLAGSGRVGVIDFDAVAMDDPLADAASFLARLDGHILDRDTRYQAAEIFRREYEAATGMNRSMDCLDWHQTAQSLRQAFSKMAHLRPGWRDFMDHCISRSSDNVARRKW